MRRNRRGRPGDRRLTSGSPRFQPPAVDGDWTPELAYAVGLIATDGCLSNNAKTVTQVSKDLDLLETFQRCLGTRAKVSWNQRAYRVQICDVGLYVWLESIGLTPRKSLTLSSVSVPNRLFADFVRGLMDGDGSIKYSVVVPNPRDYPLHTYPRLRVEFCSASEAHLVWLRGKLRELYSLVGWMTSRDARPNPLFVLRYSKHESIRLLSELYRDPSAPRLDRKWRIWVAFSSTARPTRIWTSRRSDETGKHSGLKHPWAHALEGSTPSSGTDNEKAAN